MLSCGNLQHAQVMHHTHHRPSGCLGIPWASVKSHSNSIVYIAPKIEMKINVFSPFFAMQTQLHLNTEVKIHVYMLYIVYIGKVAVSRRFRERTFVSFVDFVQFITCKIYWANLSHWNAEFFAIFHRGMTELTSVQPFMQTTSSGARYGSSIFSILRVSH